MKKTSDRKLGKFLESFKRGFVDIKLVLEEQNLKLFLKQAVVIALLILAYRYVNGALLRQKENVLGQIDAVVAQQDNEKDYLANKKKLLDLEPRFPDLADKNDWLLRQVIGIFRDAKLTPNMSSNQTEDSSNSGYVVAALPVTLRLSYGEFGKLLADIENKDEYLRVSEFSLTKEKTVIGQNTVSMKFNTVFPKEKVAAALFKDVQEKGAKKAKGEKAKGAKK